MNFYARYIPALEGVLHLAAFSPGRIMTRRVLRGKAREGKRKLQDEKSPTGVPVLFSPAILEISARPGSLSSQASVASAAAALAGFLRGDTY